MSTRRPNLVLIMTDTQGADCVESWNPRGLQTGGIDRLAREGVRFARAYTTSPVCTPARAGLFSGIYSQRSGAWTNSLPLGTNVRHLGQWLQAAGYRTAYIGKWHLDGHDYFGTGQCPPGWEEPYWFDGKRYLASLTPEEVQFWRRGVTPASIRARQVSQDMTWAWRSNRIAERFLDDCADSERPFCLVVSYDEPHHPFLCPVEDLEAMEGFRLPIGPAWNDDLADKPEHFRRWAANGWCKERRPEFTNDLYFACNRFAGRMVEDLVRTIDAKAGGDTLIGYTADHGDMHWAHGLTAKGPAGFDEITRIPLILRGAGLRAGHVVETPVSHADVLPTFLTAAGIMPPPVLDGVALQPFLAGHEDADRGVVVEYHRYELAHDGFLGYSPMRTWVTRAWKLTIHESGMDELYHLAEDPHEVVNRINDPACAAIRDGLHDRLLGWMDQHRDPWRGESWRSRPWRSLKAIPYIAASRPNPADGFTPPYLDYSTAKPERAVFVEGH